MMNDHPLSSEKACIGVLGGGAWGSALALHCGRKGHDVMIWAREQEVVESINSIHENTQFFKVCRRILFVLVAYGAFSLLYVHNGN
jgi:3-hydroxyisobutyrate dehydrogenase-like beta-hydroxyacid dehydrogenase